MPVTFTPFTLNVTAPVGAAAPLTPVSVADNVTVDSYAPLSLLAAAVGVACVTERVVVPVDGSYVVLPP